MASAFSPLAGRRWRQPDEGLARLTLQRLLLVLALLFTPMHAFAVNPDEVLADPALEQRARTLSAELRCMVCQNQSIDDSNAELARDLRLVVRERLVGGDTDEQVLDYVVSRYGEFVLLKPRLSVRTIALWGAPAALAIIGLIVAVVYTRRRSLQPMAKLSPDEEARLGTLLDRE
jgi:cytochrome c-type biogenesis protein CcmH